MPPVLGRGSHRKRLPFGVLWHELLIDQILYIADFYDSNSGNVPSEIDNFCFDNHDNGSDNVSYNDIDTVFDCNFIDDMSSDTISRIVHTNTNHDNVDNATVRSRIVSTTFCDNVADYGDNIIDSGIVYTNIDHTSCNNVDAIVVISGIVDTNTNHMSYDNVDIVPTSSRIVHTLTMTMLIMLSLILGLFSLNFVIMIMVIMFLIILGLFPLTPCMY
jgi:hypothetical protein